MKQLLALLTVLSLLAACPSSQPSHSREATAAQRPNIIYILADDLGYGDLSCYGQVRYSTPNLDQMAAEGMRFTQHYSGATVCAPSRSALMTGQHTGHTPVRGNKEVTPEGQWPLDDSVFTLAEMFQQAGYVTGGFGKWGLGFPGSEGDPNHQGFDLFYGYNCQRLAHHYYPYRLWDNQDTVWLAGNAGKQKEQYAPDLIQDALMQFLEANQDTQFFAYVPMVIPHAELVAPESYMARFRGEFGAETPYKGYDEGEKYRAGPYESQAEPHAAYAAMVTYLDDQVGQIRAKLEELGLAENTLIVFTSDNGPHLEGGADPDFFDSNGPFRGYKRDLYDGGIRVPMIAVWPGKIPAGTESDHISAFWDMYPTFAELVDGETPARMDGISMLPELTKTGEQAAHEYLFWAFNEKGSRRAIRQGKWKAVQYNWTREPIGDIELYDLETDPAETNNLAAQHPDKVAELTSLMESAFEPSEDYEY